MNDRFTILPQMNAFLTFMENFIVYNVIHRLQRKIPTDLCDTHGIYLSPPSTDKKAKDEMATRLNKSKFAFLT